jgi:hypothetical protein
VDPLDELRAVVAALPPPRPELSAYLEKVRDRAYTVTDADVERLRSSAVDEDEIFEQTVAAAVRAGLVRIDRAEEVIG